MENPPSSRDHTRTPDLPYEHPRLHPLNHRSRFGRVRAYYQPSDEFKRLGSPTMADTLWPLALPLPYSTIGNARRSGSLPNETLTLAYSRMCSYEVYSAILRRIKSFREIYRAGAHCGAPRCICPPERTTTMARGFSRPADVIFLFGRPSAGRTRGFARPEIPDPRLSTAGTGFALLGSCCKEEIPNRRL
ncbi:hypothetical protein KM043_007516 [Ampulex compressa]|nr:hypothetical protein KM043_007516 [Ampulex compressa]